MCKWQLKFRCRPNVCGMTTIISRTPYFCRAQHGKVMAEMPVPLEGWVDISRYEDFVAGAMPGVPLDQGSEALQEGVRQTFKDMGLEFVPRNWLSVVAQKA